MTPPEAMDRQLREWLQDELSTLGVPDRAVRSAMGKLSAVPQRHQPWSLLTRLRKARQADRPLSETEPEVVVWAIPGRRDAPPLALPRAGGPAPVTLAAVLAVVCVGLLASVLGLGALSHGPFSAALVSAPGGSSPTPRPALEPDALDGTPRQLIVDGGGSGHFWTITDALEAAAEGDSIDIAPGEYHESIVVDKDVSIRGTGEPGTVVLAPATVASAGSAVRIPDPRLNAVPDGFAMLGLRSPDEAWDTMLLERGWRYVLYLDHTDATISDLTIVGSEVGTAVIIQGGAPTLSGLLIDPEGEQRNKTASEPHEGVAIGGGSTATIRDSTIAAYVSVGEGSRPEIAGNAFAGTCMLIGGEGSEPLISGNRFEDSECPRYSLWVLDGAAPSITSNVILGDHITDGMRVNGASAAPAIEGNTIDGGDTGIWIGDGATGVIGRNRVSGTRTGILVVDAHPTISANDVVGNGIGIAIEGPDRPELVGNTVCGNDRDLEVRDGEFDAPGGLVACPAGSPTGLGR